jgi:hypothetical protein
VRAVGDRPGTRLGHNSEVVMPTFTLVRSALATERFKLDRERFADYLIASGVERFGFNCAAGIHFGEAIAARFEDAERANAILGPPAAQPVLYPVARDWLLAAVRERSCGESPQRQLATRSFDAFEVACHGDERFEECCAGIEAVLDRASALLPSFAALRRGERNAYLDLTD